MPVIANLETNATKTVRAPRRFEFTRGALKSNFLSVSVGVARLNELEFPAHGLAEGQKLRLGFRPYSVQVSPELDAFRYQAVLRHTYFLGIMLRIELELPSGLIIRSRMTKEEYARLNLSDGMPVSFQIRNYRVLGSDDGKLSAEVSVSHQIGTYLGEGI